MRGERGRTDTGSSSLVTVAVARLFPVASAQPGTRVASAPPTSHHTATQAEAQCAVLAKAGKVYAAASEDMDTLTFGAPRLVRRRDADAHAVIKPLRCSLRSGLDPPTPLVPAPPELGSLASGRFAACGPARRRRRRSQCCSSTWRRRARA